MERYKQNNIVKEVYSFNDIRKDLFTRNKELRSYNFDTILAISRGGMTFAHLLSQLLDIRNIFTINSKAYDGMKKNENVIIDIENFPILHDNLKNILIVDDIVDSGDTMKKVVEQAKEYYPNKKFTSISIYQNSDACFTSDIYFHKKNVDWIDFFWEF